MSKPSVNISQWHDRTQEPIIVWTYNGYWQLEPVAVDDSHEADIYQEYASAVYATGCYMTREQVEEEYADDYTPDEIDELYSTDRAGRAGLPVEWYVEGVNDDGSDAIIYVDEETTANTRREEIDEAAKYIDPDSILEIYREIIEARKEYGA